MTKNGRTLRKIWNFKNHINEEEIIVDYSCLGWDVDEL